MHYRLFVALRHRRRKSAVGNRQSAVTTEIGGMLVVYAAITSIWHLEKLYCNTCMGMST